MKFSKYYIEEIFMVREERRLSVTDHYAILIVLSGSCRWSLEKENGFCTTGDMLYIRPDTQLVIRHSGNGRKNFYALFLTADSELFQMLSDEETDLELAFANLAEAVTYVRSNSSSSMLVRNLIKRLFEVKQGKDLEEAGASIYEHGILSLLFVVLYRAILAENVVEYKKQKKGLDLDDLFIYIRNHLTEDLTLNDLERQFYVSKYHIAREFKRQTGDTVHHYIVKTRLDQCREYIAQGMPINLAYRAGGFGGYNHFFRAFKLEYGVTPKEFYKSLQADK